MTIYTICIIACIAITVAIGAVTAICSGCDNIGVTLLGLAITLIGLLGTIGVDEYKARLDQYLPAEPIAYNSNQTVFNTNKGNIIANGIYPDGEYMLVMDNNEVLVVWQAVEGEEGLG